MKTDRKHLLGQEHQDMKGSCGRALGSALLLLLLTTSVNGMEVSARIATPVTEYRNISLRELVAAYERAYGAQKFHLQATTERTAPEGDRTIRLVLDMANPVHAARKKAQLSFLFHSPGKGACTPCSVTRELFSVGDHDEYTGEEWMEFQHRLIAADHRALDQVKRVLGTSVPRWRNKGRRPLPLTTGCRMLPRHSQPRCRVRTESSPRSPTPCISRATTPSGIRGRHSAACSTRRIPGRPSSP
jgi:hypothetical protein